MEPSSHQDTPSTAALTVAGLPANAVMDVDQNQSDAITRSKTEHIPGDLSCCQRMKLLLSPIQRHETIVNGANSKTVISVSPEAFRMVFYLGFIVYTAIAMTISLIWADIDYDDNVLLDRFGSINICIFYDFPPFNYFGATLWLPNVFLITIYFVFDLFRIHDAVNDGELSRTFYRCYSAVTVFEVFSFCFFLQITATTPQENVYMHTIPFIIVTFAQWTLAFKRLMWFAETGRIKTFHRGLQYAAYVYVVLMFIVIGGKTLLNVPNLFGAQLWTIEGLEWTGLYSAINDRIFLVLTMIMPPCIYFVAAKDIETVVMTIDREVGHWMKPSAE